MEDDPIAKFFVTVAKNISDHSEDMVNDLLDQADSFVTLRQNVTVRERAVCVGRGLVAPEAVARVMYASIVSMLGCGRRLGAISWEVCGAWRLLS